jgi:hypothetical protein
LAPAAGAASDLKRHDDELTHRNVANVLTDLDHLGDALVTDRERCGRWHRAADQQMVEVTRRSCDWLNERGRG